MSQFVNSWQKQTRVRVHLVFCFSVPWFRTHVACSFVTTRSRKLPADELRCTYIPHSMGWNEYHSRRTGWCPGIILPQHFPATYTAEEKRLIDKIDSLTLSILRRRQRSCSGRSWVVPSTLVPSTLSTKTCFPREFSVLPIPPLKLDEGRIEKGWRSSRNNVKPKPQIYPWQTRHNIMASRGETNALKMSFSV